MNIEVFDYFDVKKRASELDCNQPTSLALLPENLATARSRQELVYRQSTSTVRELWSRVGIVETDIQREGDTFQEIQVKGGEWIGPIIFVGAAAISQNASLISIALGVVSNYLTDLFKGNLNQKQMTLDIVVEQTKGKTYKRLHFEGSVRDFKNIELAEHVRRIQQDN